MTAKVTIALSIAAIVLVIDLLTDYWIEKKNLNNINPKGFVNHRLGLVLRCAGLAVPIILTWWLLALVICFTYWILFNGCGNLLARERWSRIGTTSALDKLELKYPAITRFKYIGFGASVILYLIFK